MVLLVAASPIEFAGIPRVTRLNSDDVRWLGSATLGGERTLLVANGCGPRAADAAVRSVAANQQCRALVSSGFAGALVPDLAVGDVLVADAVRTAGGGGYQSAALSAQPASVRRGTLVSVEEVVQTAAAKRALANGGAVAVDMESVAIAAAAAEMALPFHCVRAISDGADEDLPVDFNRALQANGTFSMWSILGQTVTRPRSWKGLARLRRHAALASRSLALCLDQCRFGYY